jgi:hypothetical protein
MTSYWAAQYLRAELQLQWSRALGPALPVIQAMLGQPPVYRQPQLPPGQAQFAPEDGDAGA